MPDALRTYPPNMPWAIVALKDRLFAIASEDMREIVAMPEVAQVPGAPGYIRGVINLRGRVLPVVDLRKRLGFESAPEEIEAFCAMMRQREQDHRNWLNELESSVQQRRPFALTTDPHKCAFGKWYDTYRTGNVWVAALLKKFDKPHQQIHAVAIDVERLKNSREYEEAERLIGQTRHGVLSSMLKLFAELQDLVRSEQRETAIVLAQADRHFAVTVDAAQSIEKFPGDAIEEVSSQMQVGCDGVVRRLARTGNGKHVILLIETDRLLAGCGSAPA